MDGSEARFDSPREAVAAGIATVYQDLALFPLMSIARNFIVGTEPARGPGMLRSIDFRQANEIVRQKLLEIGITIRSPSDLVGTLSGGERQSLAIARAEHIGARLLILDEPTSALGVKEAAIVLRHVLRARATGLAIVFITHNVHHAYVVGDRFLFLKQGRVVAVHPRDAISVEEMTRLMGGEEELEDLAEELEQLRRLGDEARRDRDATVPGASRPPAAAPARGAEMQSRPFPPLQRPISRIALGTFPMAQGPTSDAFRILGEWLALGGNVLDTAMAYGDGEAERVVGRFLESSRRRSDIVILTKGCHPLADGRPRVTPQAIHDDLSRACDACARITSTSTCSTVTMPRSASSPSSRHWTRSSKRDACSASEPRTGRSSGSPRPTTSLLEAGWPASHRAASS